MENEPLKTGDLSSFLTSIRAENDRLTVARGKRPGVHLLTFGCQQNEADSEKIAGLAEAMGYETVRTPEEADLIVVNTCAVREHAEKKALSITGQFKHLKAKNPDLILAMCGCMVTQPHRAEEIKKRYPYVDIVFGTGALHLFPQLLFEKKQTGKRKSVPDVTETVIAEGIPIRRESRYRAWVSIMYGCNNFCTYCIVPYVRGRERSRDHLCIEREVEELVKAGYKDITLLGQNVNSYGKDRADGFDFADLLARLDEIPGDYILRFMTSHPKDASRKLIETMARSKHVAHQFHLPLQSGSDATLRRMNRVYTTERYLETVDFMRKQMPDVTLSSDIIVGFPGESEEDFAGTLEMLEKVRFDMIFSFIYSRRKGTPAAEMEDQVPPEVQHERFDRLLALQNQIAKEKNQPLIGKPLRVLCDGPSKNDPKLLSGRTEGNKIVFFEGNIQHTGRFVTFVADRADAYALYGSIREERKNEQHE